MAAAGRCPDRNPPRHRRRRSQCRGDPLSSRTRRTRQFDWETGPIADTQLRQAIGDVRQAAARTSRASATQRRYSA
ncbi:hypothetical protein PJI17_18095 [Mycobacterium kansasii]